MSAPERPPQTRTGPQITGADPELSVWVSANAGTGKTQVLTDRISRLLLAGIRPERILCLTFTKAAAAEMEMRLSERLGKWAMASDDTLTAELAALLDEAPPADLLAPARRLFAATLDAPGGLKIRTIHAFCESLLGRFPVEAAIAPHFSVIDERTAAELMAEARDRVLTEGNVARELAHISALLNEDDFARLMRELAGARGRLHRMIRDYGSPEGLAGAARTALGLGDDETTENVVSGAIANLDEAALKAALDVLRGGAKTDKKQADALQRFFDATPDQRTALFRPHYLPLFFTQKDEPRQKLITKKLGETNPDTLATLEAEQQRLGRILDKLKAVDVAANSRALIVVGAALIGRFESLKRQRALLDYDDLIEKTRDLLRTKRDVSWVLYKLDGGLDHILVDEAQDTAPDQWQVIESLAGDFFSGEGRAEISRTIFAVGDEKQSIYSFQGADPHMFGTMKQRFAEHATAAGKEFKPVELAVSYRSTESVLKTVDKIFESEAAGDGLTFEGKPIRHLWSRDGQAGLVEVWPTCKPGETLELKPWDAPLDRAPIDSPEDRLAGKIADTINGWLDSGEELQSAGRPIEAGDIMILLQKRGRFAEKMVNALKQKNIPVAGADRMVLGEQLAVMDLLALARFVLLPDDDLNLAVVLKGPLIGLDDDDLIELAPGRQGSLWAALKENPDYGDARQRLGELLGRADYMAPYEFFSDLLGAEGGRKALLARLGPEAGDPIDEFLNLALDYERQHVASMQSFVHWIEATDTQIKRDLEHGRGQIRVMTVHGSKGLQANVVFLPDTCTVPDKRYDPKLKWRDDPEPALLWPGHKGAEETVTRALSETVRARIEEENRRLLYVAATRARDRLYVCGWETKKGRPKGCWYDLIVDALDIDTDKPLYRLENKQTAATETKIVDKAGAPDSALPDWALADPPPEPEPSRPLSPSRPAGDPPPVFSPTGTDDGLRFRRGNIIHRLLESVPDIAPEGREAAIAAYLARSGLGLDTEEQAEISAETMVVLDNPDFAPLFGPDSLPEVPICGVIDGRVISGRIDRLLVTPEEVSVIDYKTNRPPPDSVEAIAPAYINQMAAYRALLGEVYPGRKITCILAWTHNARLMVLPDHLLNKVAP